MAAIDRQVFFKEYAHAMREGDAALFVGAGVSRAAGYVDWKALLKDIAEELQLSIDREGDLVTLAQFHVNHRGGRDRLNQLLIDEFLENVELTENHRLISSLPVSTVWTTNYDDLLERAFEDASKRVDVKRRQDDFAITRARTDVTVYKMHGDKSLPAEAVITKDDYEMYDATRELFTIALKGDLAKKTFLFLGFSFTDPNVMYVLSRVKQLLEKNSRKHFCILKAPSNDDGEDADYQGTRFSHWLSDLHRYNIQPVLIESYDEITAILQELNRRSHLRDVFISGSAVDFAPLGQEAFHELCRSLGAELIKSGFNIISGFGSGVGDLIVVGAMQSLKRNDDERLQLWPFPHQVPTGEDRVVLWRKYREGMISNAGVCVVLAGNGTVNGEVALAAGVREEVEIALQQGKVVIPVGATGHVARELWESCQAEPQRFVGGADIASQLAVLGNPAVGIPALVRAIIEVLKKLEQ